MLDSTVDSCLSQKGHTGSLEASRQHGASCLLACSDLPWQFQPAEALKGDSQEASPKVHDVRSGFGSSVTKLPVLGCGQPGSWAPTEKMIQSQPR